MDMMMINNESNLQEIFSIRCDNLFKKASELFTLCGVGGAIIVFSPGNEVYSFGHPNVVTVKDWLVNGVPPILSDGRSINQVIVDAQCNSNIHTLNMELTYLENMLVVEKGHDEELNRIKEEGQKNNWFPPLIKELNKEGLVTLSKRINNFKKGVDKHVTELTTLMTQSGYGHRGEMNITHAYQARIDPYLTMASNTSDNNVITLHELFKENETHSPLNLTDNNVDPNYMMADVSSSGTLFTGSGASTYSSIWASQ